MAEYIVRAWSIRLYNDPEGFPAASSTPYFQDVQPGDFGFAYIQKLYELGITKGCSGQSPTISFCPLDTLENIQIAIFVARARALADYGCTAPNYNAPLQTMPVSSDPNCVLDNYMASDHPFFADVQNVAPVSWFHAVQRLGDLDAVNQVQPSPLVVSGYADCGTCYFYEGNSTTRGQMAIWTVVGMGLDPLAVLSMNAPSVGGGSNTYTTFATFTTAFTYTMHDQAGGEEGVAWAQFFLAGSGQPFPGGLHCEGNWGSNGGLNLYDGTPTTQPVGFNQPLEDNFCTVSLVSINVINSTDLQVTVNFTFSAESAGAYSVYNQTYLTSGYVGTWENVGTLTLKQPFTLSSNYDQTVNYGGAASGLSFLSLINDFQSSYLSFGDSGCGPGGPTLSTYFVGADGFTEISAGLAAPGVYNCTLDILVDGIVSSVLAFQFTVAQLTCPASVAKGGSVTCTIAGAPASVISGWTFTGGGAIVPGPSSVTSWSGTMVVSGTVSATVGNTVLQQPITVTPRSWHTVPAAATVVNNGQLVINGTPYFLPVPPQPGGISPSGLGESTWLAAYSRLGSTIISGGPNAGFAYYATPISFTTFNFQSEVNPDLLNQNSTFSMFQCGVTGPSDPAPNPNGFISWVNLLSQTQRHEYNSTTQSHWAFYSNSMNTNNPGDYIEARIATPNYGASFDTDTGNGITALLGRVKVDAVLEPYGVNESETGQPLGNVNYAQPNYASCN